MHLSDMYSNTLLRLPQENAVFYAGQHYSYSYLDEDINRIANALIKLGVEPQDRIMIMLNNRLENLIIFWAVQKINAVYVPLNIDMSFDYIQYCIEDVEAKVLFIENDRKNIIDTRELNNKLVVVGIEGEVDLSYKELLSSGESNLEGIVKSEEDIAVILYTSGTSGKPKGVPRTHKNEYAATMAHIIQNNYRQGDSTIGAVQLYHTMGMRAYLSMVFLGGTYYSNPNFDADDILTQIQDFSITTLFLTPTQYHDMLCACEGYCDVSSVRVISYAGAPMSSHLIGKVDHFFQPDLFINHYGSTEIYTFSTSDKIREKPWSAGRAGIHSKLQIAPINIDYRNDDEDNEEFGEIIVRLDSDEAFKGYWNRPDETAKVIKNGWFYTGDIGRIEEDGELVVIGRLDELILSNSENIHPHIIESVLNAHPDVVECAVVGEADDRLGELLSAYIISNNKVTFLDLDTHCKKSGLHSNLRPRKYTFIENMPKTAKGKINRRLLKKGYIDKIES